MMFAAPGASSESVKGDHEEKTAPFDREADLWNTFPRPEPDGSACAGIG